MVCIEVNVDVLGISRNGLGIFSFRKHILIQVEHSDVEMMGILSKEIQNVFVVSPF